MELVREAGRLADAEKPDEAMELVNNVLLHEPDNVSALYVAGCVFLKAVRSVQAIQTCKRIIELKPRDPRGYGLLTLAYGDLHKYEEAIAYGEKALSLKRTPKTLADAAYAHLAAGNWDLADKYSLESLVMGKERLAQPPVFGDKQDAEERKGVEVAMADALTHQSSIRLAKRDWKSGFEGFRRTLRTKWRKEWTYGDSKEWMGEPDAVVMVTGEQGLGDEIMAASVIHDAAKGCKRFIFDCDHRLAALFARSFPEVLVVPTRRKQTVALPVMPTHHKSLFGLSELFRTHDQDFPRKPFLIANSEYKAMFGQLFYQWARGGPVTGIAWSGGLPRTGEETRNAGLRAFLPLIRQGGTFVSLQYKDEAAEVAAFEREFGIKIHRLPWVTQGQDMDLLAGLVASLDKVVGVHTSALHLSSALGVDTTILVHRGSGWRYASDDLIWYPRTTKIHRKASGESWRDCVARCR